MSTLEGTAEQKSALSTGCHFQSQPVLYRFHLNLIPSCLQTLLDSTERKHLPPNGRRPPTGAHSLTAHSRAPLRVGRSLTPHKNGQYQMNLLKQNNCSNSSKSEHRVDRTYVSSPIVLMNRAHTYQPVLKQLPATSSATTKCSSLYPTYPHHPCKSLYRNSDLSLPTPAQRNPST